MAYVSAAPFLRDLPPFHLQETKPAVSVDPAFISEQLAQVSEMPSVVAQGLKQQTALRYGYAAARVALHSL